MKNKNIIPDFKIRTKDNYVFEAKGWSLEDFIKSLEN